MGWHPFAKQASRERQLDAELRFHLEQRIADNLASGMSPGEARRRALLEFGSLDRVKDECRALHWEAVVESLYCDFRYTLRLLARDVRFSILAILALGLGIGSTTVIFSAVYGVILNTFPFRDADQVTSFGIQDLKNPSNGRREILSMLEFLDYRALNHVFQDISGEYGGFDSRPVRYTTGEETYQFSADYMSANSFAFFGVTPVAGRLATPDDTRPGAPPVFMMSYRLWQQQFNANPNIVGTNFMLNGMSRTLVGIMPPRFRWGWSEIWIPFPIDRGQVASDAELSKETVWCVGRLKPGVTLQQAEADLDVVAHQLAKIDPKAYPEQFTVTANRLTDRVTGPFKSLMYPLMGAVLLLLLIACSNVANLLLAKATVREGEIAVRASLGASRARLIRQFLVETSVLAAAGCISGCLLAYIGIRAIVPIIPYDAFPQEAVINLNSKVLLFSLGIATLTTFICGLAPAFHSVGRNLQLRLTGSRKGILAESRHGKSRAVLVILEVALSMVLLVGAALMMRTFFGLTHVELGFTPQHVLTARVPLPPAYKHLEQRRQVYDKLLDRIRSIPGVNSVSESVAIPPYSGDSDVTVPGEIHSEKWHARLDLVTDGYFHTIGLRLLRGRLFTADEVRSGRRIVVINQLLARKCFENKDPIGQQIKFEALDELPGAPHDAYFEIVGVVSDARNRGLANEPAPEGYLPFIASPDVTGFLLIRATAAPASIWPAIRHAVWTLDSNIALTDVGSLQSWMQRDTFAFPEFELTTMSTFAGIGLLLIVIGVFSVMAYTVSLQTHEIGVRMALGAEQGDVLRTVIGKGLALIGTGVFIGVLVSVALTRYLGSQVWGISARDPWTYGAVVICVLLVGLVSCLAPARRAAKVDPMVALRYE